VSQAGLQVEQRQVAGLQIAVALKKRLVLAMNSPPGKPGLPNR